MTGGTVITADGWLKLGSDTALPIGEDGVFVLGHELYGSGVLDLNGHDLTLSELGSVREFKR